MNSEHSLLDLTHQADLSYGNICFRVLQENDQSHNTFTLKAVKKRACLFWK